MRLPLKDIQPNPDNPRIIKDDKFKKLVTSLANFPEMAEVRELVLNKDHMILGGNMRYKAMQEAGWKDAPVQIVDWTEEQQREFIIKDNVAGGEWDWDALANDWDSGLLDDWGLDLRASFGDDEVEEDEAPEVSSEPAVSQLGEVYQLGRHRLMCGDATTDVATLMGGIKANLVFTDPPYGVTFERGKFVGRSKAAKGQTFTPIKGDDLRGDSLRELVATALKQAYEYSTEASIYCWSPPLNEGYEILRAIQDAGFKVQSQIIWNKSPFVIGRADYHWKHEICWYGFQEKHKWYGERDKSTVWDVAKIREAESHPTMKPLELPFRAIKNSTQPNGVVLDVFGGSGSTLIACEQLDRTCYMMELDPKYCDVIRKRYAKFIGQEDWETATHPIYATEFSD